MTLRRILAGALCVALLVSSMAGVSILSVSAEDYTAWVNTHNLERYRGTSLTAAERAVHTATDGGSDAVTAQATAITAGKTSDADRLLAIHDWVADNIAYDYDFYEEKTTQTGKTADEVLQWRRAVCEGIAELTMQLCRAVGIPCKTVDGYTLGEGESWGAAHQTLRKDQLTHVWNEAFVNGRWQIMDVTWDTAGDYRDGTVTKGEVGHDWFDIPPASLSDTRLNLEDITDGTFVYAQAADGTLTLTAPLDKALTAANIPANVVGRAVVAVGDQAFSGCKTLATVTLPDTVKTLGHSAFSGTGLTALPNMSNVTEAGSFLFSACVSLTTAELPSHWTTLPASMFSDCSKLAEVTLPTSLKTIGDYAFRRTEKLETLSFPEGLERIGNDVFANSGITAAVLPSSVTTIGAGTFRWCRSLKSVTLPQGLTSIPNGAFQGCSTLGAITVPSSVKTIGNEAFLYCNQLSAITLSEGVLRIGDSAFEGCLELQTVTLPNTLETIGKSAFRSCQALKTVHLPHGVHAVGEMVFADCASLESITVAPKNTALQVNDGVLYSVGEPYTLLAYPSRLEGATFTVPEEVERVGARAFAGAVFLEKVQSNAALPDEANGNSAWGDAAFEGCGALRELHMIGGAKSLPATLLRKCSALEAITFPDTLIGFPFEMFIDCSQLKELNIPASVRSISTPVLMQVEMPGLERVNVHEDNEWYYDIDGVLFRKADNALFWYPGQKRDATYTIPDGVQAVYPFAFAGNLYLTELVIPEGVTTIHMFAFSGCRNLASVTFPESLRTIDLNAFEATALREFSLPKGLTSLGDGVFNYTPWWDAQPEGLVYCGDVWYGYKGEEPLTGEVVVREGTRMIIQAAFHSCEWIDRLVIPASVEIILPAFTSSRVVIVGKRGSAAEEYARMFGNRFVDPDSPWGDVNGDGKVNTTDARKVLQYAAGVIGENDLSLAAADVNGDDKVNTTDARMILQYAANLIDKFPVEG